VELVVEHALTVYDAAYLELGLRAGLPIAMLDAALAGAAGLVESVAHGR
jgi:predicted nucleic acid-binding protein